MDTDGPEYDQHVRDQVESIQFKVGSDGTPYIMAEVRMHYTTKVPQSNNSYSSLNSPNVQTILFSKKEGAWLKHGFRNLQSEWYIKSFLLVNPQGNINAMVWNRPSLEVHTLKGEGWQIRSKTKFGPDGSIHGLTNYGYGNYLIMSAGEETWQAVSSFEISGKMNSVALQRNGSRIILDSNRYLSFMASFSDINLNYFVGQIPNIYNQNGNPGANTMDTTANLIFYSWTLAPGDIGPTKQLLKVDNVGGHWFFAKVLGETRLYGNPGTNFLLEYAIRERELVFLTSRQLPYETSEGGDPQKNTATFHNIAVDTKGCIHGLLGINRPGEIFNGYAKNIALGFLHKSSCGDAVDSLIFPNPIPVEQLLVTPSEIHFAADGLPMIALSLTKDSFSERTPNYSIPPTWIYFGKSTGLGNWSWEKVAEF
jgi:hypothetical protein